MNSARRILIVDDSESDAEWVMRLLTSQSDRYSVSCVDTVEEGLRLAAQVSFDLVICDWDLPDGSGADFATRQLQQGLRLPVVIVTGFSRPEMHVEVLRSGAAEFLPKDEISAKTLVRICEHAIVRARLQRDVEQAREAEALAGRREREARHTAEQAFAEEARLRKQVLSLQALSASLSAAATSHDVGSVVIAHAALLGGATACSLYVLGAEALERRGVFGFEEPEAAQRLELHARLPVVEAVRRGELVRVPNAEAHRRAYPALDVHEGDAWLVLPLLAPRGVVGAIGLRYPEQRLPGGDELDMLQLISGLIAQAVERSASFEDAKRRADQEKRLLAIVGHDLRTPLSAITMACALLSQQQPQNQIIQRIERSATRMARIIEDVMSRSATEQRAQAARETGVVDLERLLADQVDELRAAFPERRIELEVAGGLEVPLDASRVSQIVANLVRNAFQHGDRGSPVILRARLDNGVRIDVHNHGEPIDPQQLGSLFEPFQRGANARSTGIGLGLYIVRELTQAMGGEVRVSSGQHGTTFSVDIPLTRVAEA